MKELMSAFRRVHAFQVRREMLLLQQQGGVRFGVPGRLVKGLGFLQGCVGSSILVPPVVSSGRLPFAFTSTFFL